VSHPVRVLERVMRVAPIGLRFQDAATGEFVSDGLRVIACPERSPWRQAVAYPNRSGVYVLRDLPGMRALEQGAGDAEYWRDVPADKPRFVVEVVDEQRRFQPFTFTVDAPHKGVVTPAINTLGSPVDGAPGIPLFSAPNRLAPAGMAVVRADLWDVGGAGERSRPAAWAVLEVTVPASRPGLSDIRVRGVADELGRVAVMFPYPVPAARPLGSPLGSPVASTQVPLARQQWDMVLNAAYRRLASVPRLPALSDLLAAVPAARQVFENAAGTRPLAVRQLSFGQELIVTSAGEAGDPPPSVVFVTPVGSPP
jgi:hypothetical protein